MFGKKKVITREEKLNTAISKAMGAKVVFVEAIKSLRESNEELLEIKSQIDSEIASLNEKSDGITDSVEHNTKLAENLENLFK